ncbi:MAG: hypothetical protein WC819_04240 [Parcubacteria group bacterium]
MGTTRASGAVLTEEKRVGNQITFGLTLHRKKTTFTITFDDVKEVEPVTEHGVRILTKDGAPVFVTFSALQSIVL